MDTNTNVTADMKMNVDINIEKLTAKDYDEALGLLNLSFHGNGSTRPSFEISLPKMWKRDDIHMGRHLACRAEDGKLCSIVGIYPLKTRIGRHSFMFYTVGNVATHPDYRNMGHMKCLMSAAIKELDRLAADAARLGGLRQRYERYGFEPAGTKYTYQLTKRNILSLSNYLPRRLSFVPISPDSLEYLTKAQEMFNKQVFFVERESPEDFYLTTKAWLMAPWAALDENEKMTGYIVASENRNMLAEIFADNADDFITILFSWVIQNNLDSVRLDLAPWDRQYCRLLGQICESVSVSAASSFCIKNWAGIINALIEMKSRMDDLPDGSFVLGIEGYGSIIMQVRGNKGSCSRTDREAELTLGPLDATRLLLGHMPPWTVIDLSTTDKGTLLNSWLPVPFSWNGQD
ncbi:MAG: GNAT family N-acetyltransferase, partial [Eubacteriales bacterium]|nr:GNAT family N-acetyltransferase [Eubacteriales bacterium]